ncbi:MAG: hypothetical protein M3268_00665 [Acidobacteriota bacterium]|nr:hypothetical protein [Acidobacteriota bacterium]
MNRRVLLFAAVCVSLVAGIATAYAVRRSRPGPFVPYTATYQVEDRSLDGTLIESETHVIWRRSDGAYHETRDTSDGRSYDTFGDPARGAFVRKGDGPMYQLSPAYQPDNKPAAEWRAMQGYVRDDKIAGVPVVVVESQHDANTMSWVRNYVSPELGGLLVKEEIFTPAVTTTKTLVTLVRGEPQRAVPPIPDGPTRPIHN